MNILVVLDQRLDRVGRQLESNLVPQYHVHVNNLCFDMNELVVEESLY